ncbi:hypothetical protein IAR55_001848 [Kwoniella newhampshirensis]|uniref:Uncharacterized protein n=1 Tax=Kwoniella newhampshirensis TaxID=1651941 RepID=A0AAW0Z3C3_9TREE
MSTSLKDQYEASQKAARGCGEVLFYARIWAENILADPEWTSKSTPFDLPPRFFRPDANRADQHEHDRRPSRHWLDRLIWDPQEDEYPTAVSKVLARKSEKAREECRKDFIHFLAMLDQPRDPP